MNENKSSKQSVSQKTKIKNQQTRREQKFPLVDKTKVVSFRDAIDLIKLAASAKFNESIDLAINLGIDAKKSDQNVRGFVVLPNGTGKIKRVAVFAQEKFANDLKLAGADIVGMDDLAEQIKKNEINFDVLVAMPDTMKLVGQLGQILGPRGLMPNPKVGTVTNDVVTCVKNIKSGQIQFKNDKYGIVHACIGKASFSSDQLLENTKSLIDALLKAKPSTQKGKYMVKTFISSTMGVGVSFDYNTL